MSSHRSEDATESEITSSSAFREALSELLAEASENGVEVRGGWPVTGTGDESPTWDVEVTPLSRQTTHRAPEDGEFPTEAILEAVASRRGVQKNELPPLQRSVDVDSITKVYADLSRETPGEVTFTYCGYTISVYGDGHITVDG